MQKLTPVVEGGGVHNSKPTESLVSKEEMGMDQEAN